MSLTAAMTAGLLGQNERFRDKWEEGWSARSRTWEQIQLGISGRQLGLALHEELTSLTQKNAAGPLMLLVSFLLCRTIKEKNPFIFCTGYIDAFMLFL